MNSELSAHFSASYLEARSKFNVAAETLGATIGGTLQSFVLPAQTGVASEPLSMEALRLGSPAAKSLLIISSGMHGVEGYCGSGCQLALMNDTELLSRFECTQTALLLIHAINPYGFSHGRRTNEDNIDLNRNFIDFEQGLPANVPYAEIDALLLPEHWPPTPENAGGIEQYIALNGEMHYRDAVSMGQSSHPQGMFYRGLAPAWSNRTVRQLVREQGAACEQISWIDIHTGLGPCGHGEKIFAGHNERFADKHDPLELARARAFWGADVFSIFDHQSVSRNSLGGGISCLVDECPQASTTGIGLEFGTLDRDTVIDALRTEHWLNKYPPAKDSPAKDSPATNPQSTARVRQEIKRDLLRAFYVDTPEWRAMVCAQVRVMALQALLGMARC